MVLDVKAVTFDDFFTLRYSIREREDIIYPILRGLKRQGVDIDDAKFLEQYFEADRIYRKKLEETFHESLLDNIVTSALVACGYKTASVNKIVERAVDFGLSTRQTRWFSDAKKTLLILKEKGYKLGLISNTHWRFPEKLKKDFGKLFGVITLSYEHGYVKPHPSIFITTLEKLKTDANYCLHVGDDPVADIQGAKNVGMKTAFIQRTSANADADIKIKRLIELTTFLRRL